MKIDRKHLEIKEILEQALSSKPKSADHEKMSVEELIQELNIYYREIEYQNEELLRYSVDLEESRKRFEDLYDNAPIGYVTYDAAMKIIRANKMFSAITGYTVNIKQGLITEFIHPEDQDDFYFYMKKILQNRITEICKLRIKSLSENKMFILSTNITGEGNKNELRTALIDVSQVDELIAELQRKNKELNDFNNIMIDREIKMVELKEEINGLLSELGRKAKY